MHTPFITNILWDSTTEKERVEGSHNISDDGYSEYASVAVSKQEFSTGKQKNSFIVMVYSEFFT